MWQHIHDISTTRTGSRTGGVAVRKGHCRDYNRRSEDSPDRRRPRGRTLIAAESTGLESGALGPWGVFAQGLAAAAPSVALAVVPFSLFVAAGKGAAWAAVIGLSIVVLVAITISFQAKRTVSSGSLGTYTGNGLGPGFAFAAGFSLLFGYIGFATTGTLGGVLVPRRVPGVDRPWFPSGLVPPASGDRGGRRRGVPALPGVSLAAKYELAFELLAIASILVIIVASYIGYGFRIDWEQWNSEHLGSSATFIAAVTAVGSYAGFESVASLGAEAKDAHRNIARSLLRVVILIGALVHLRDVPADPALRRDRRGQGRAAAAGDQCRGGVGEPGRQRCRCGRVHRVRHRGHHRGRALAVHVRPRRRVCRRCSPRCTRPTRRLGPV